MRNSVSIGSNQSSKSFSAATSAGAFVVSFFHGVISIGALTPIRFVETTRRLRHLQIPTTSVTAPIEVKSDTLQQLSDLLPCALKKRYAVPKQLGTCLNLGL
jgi:hypothetical protein